MMVNERRFAPRYRFEVCAWMVRTWVDLSVLHGAARTRGGRTSIECRGQNTSAVYAPFRGRVRERGALIIFLFFFLFDLLFDHVLIDEHRALGVLDDLVLQRAEVKASQRLAAWPMTSRSSSINSPITPPTIVSGRISLVSTGTFCASRMLVSRLE